MEDDIRDILQNLLDNKCSIEEAEKFLKANLVENVGNLAKLDIFRKTRTGVPEVIYAEKKDSQLLLDIISTFLEKKSYAVVSRFSEAQKKLIQEEFKSNNSLDIEINQLGKIIII